jgi:hypothetical protein
MKLCRLVQRPVEFRFSETIKQCWLIQSLCIRSSGSNRCFFYGCHLDDICLSEQQTDVTTLLTARERSLHSALVDQLGASPRHRHHLHTPPAGPSCRHRGGRRHPGRHPHPPRRGAPSASTPTGRAAVRAVAVFRFSSCSRPIFTTQQLTSSE